MQFLFVFVGIEKKKTHLKCSVLTITVILVHERYNFVTCVKKVPARPTVFLFSWNLKCTVFDPILSHVPCLRSILILSFHLFLSKSDALYYNMLR